MKAGKAYICVFAACCLTAFAGSTAFCLGDGSEPTGPEFGVDLTYVPTYIWRGLVADRDSAMQPSLTVAGNSGVSANIWGSMDSSERFTEMDYTVDYAWARGPTGLSAGVIHYTFPNTGVTSTSELYLGASLDAPLSPSAVVYYDMQEADGFYVSLGGSHSEELPLGENKSTTLDLSANLGYGSSKYNAFYFGSSKSAFTDVSLGASVPFALGENSTLTPGVYYSSVLDGDLRDTVTKGGMLTERIGCLFGRYGGSVKNAAPGRISEDELYGAV